MADKIMAGAIVAIILVLLAWRVWRVVTGKASGCSCASRSCPLMQEGQCIEKDIKDTSHCRAATIVTDQAPQSGNEEGEAEDV